MDPLLKEKLDVAGISNKPPHDLRMSAEHVRVGANYALKQRKCVVYRLKTNSCLNRQS